MDLATYQKATAAAQQLLQTEVPQLIADGKWGKFTQSAYERVSGALKTQVDALIKTVGAGTTASELAAFRDKQRAQEFKPPQQLRAEFTGTVQQAIAAAAKESGISEATLQRFAQIESRGNPNAVNGSSRGLMQMQPGAWADAAKFISLPRYMDGVFDPLANARAGAAYIRNNEKVLKRLGYTGPWDAAHMYLAHQQGAGGLLNMWRAANGGKGVLSTENMLRNPPQDKRGLTTDPVEFYKRWVAVATAK